MTFRQITNMNLGYNEAIKEENNIKNILNNNEIKSVTIERDELIIELKEQTITIGSWDEIFINFEEND